MNLSDNLIARFDPQELFWSGFKAGFEHHLTVFMVLLFSMSLRLFVVERYDIPRKSFFHNLLRTFEYVIIVGMFFQILFNYYYVF